MKMRFGCVLVSMVFLVLSVTPVHASSFKEGVDYLTLSSPIKSTKTDGPFIMEYLWLGCSHCRAMNPLIKDFEQSHPKVIVETRPGIGNDRWVFDAHVFYGLYGVHRQDLVPQIMEYYGQLAHSERRLPSQTDINEYVTKQGIDPALFEKNMNSNDTLKKLSISYQDQQSFGLKGVPVFLVNGKYQIQLQSLSAASDPKARFIALIEYLLDK